MIHPKTSWRVRVVAITAGFAMAITGAYGLTHKVPTVHAQFATVEAPGPLLGATMALSTYEVGTRPALEAVGWMAAKTILDSLTQSIVTWINSGFEGSPAFVTDLNRNLGNLADAVAEDFLYELDQVVVSNTGFSIRAPFQDQINAALREEFYRTTSSYGFNVRHPYRDCYQGGGFNFNGWFCQSQNRANNPYGRYELARNELFNSINRETQNRLRELDWANGFLSWRGPCGPHRNRNTALDQENTHNLSGKDATVGCSIRTPGTVIEAQLVSSLGSGMKQLEVADNINEIVSALMSQLVNQVLGGGGLVGVSRPASGGGTSYIDRVGSGTSLSTGFLVTGINEQRTDIAGFRTDWQRIADAAARANQACSNNARAQAVLAEATGNVSLANTLLSELQAIETERAALAANPSAPSTSVNALISRYEAVIRQMRTLVRGEAESIDTGDLEPGSLYSEMTRLERTCR